MQLTIEKRERPSGTEHICHNCVRDDVLAEKLRSTKYEDICFYCGDIEPGTALDELSDWIFEVFNRDFSLTPSVPDGIQSAAIEEGVLDWEREGYKPSVLIADLAGLNELLSEHVVTRLSDTRRIVDALQGFEDPFGPEARYIETGPSTSEFFESWKAFRNELKSRSRFFSPQVESTLNELFKEIWTLRTYQAQPVVTPMRYGEENIVYRARVAYTKDDLKNFLSAPTTNLAPPPSHLARAGRMNAAGIPVFYGAFDPDTCVAEIRAPVGSYVVVGKFEVLRILHILDLNGLSDVYENSSHFDPNYPRRYARAAFLKHFVKEITQPVLPTNEDFDYLPTQVIADYLASRIEPRIDGIRFKSSQTDAGYNIVILNHACLVERYKSSSDGEIEVLLDGWDSDEESSNSIFVRETVAETPYSESQSEREYLSLSDLHLKLNDPEEKHKEPTLRLDVNGGMEVHKVTRVKYETSIQKVHRYQNVGSTNDIAF